MTRERGINILRLGAWIILGVIIGAGIFVLIYWAVWADSSPEWTGFGEYTLVVDETREVTRTKTLWDWMGLLLVPLVLALGALWFNNSQKRTELKIAEERTKAEREIASERQQQATLEAYYDRMTELLLNHGLRTKDDEEGAEVRSIARTRSLSVVRSINEERKGHVIKFLYESKLIGFIEGDVSVPGIVVLVGIDLTGADLRGANPYVTNLYATDLSRANPYATNLYATDLRGADLSGAYLIGAYLSGADLSRADLSRADLSRAYLIGAYLSGAYLIGADLRGAYLRGADLSRADLSRADLSRADLSGANLGGADLGEADLGEADLSGADLSGADPSEAYLSKARYDQSTKWPTGFDPSAYGATLRE